MMLFAFVSTATAQSMAERMTESVAAHLSLNASQKSTVLKLYKAEESKKRQKQEAARAKQSDKARAAREKAKKSKKTSKKLKSSGKSVNKKAATPSSEMFLRIAYKKAKLNPAFWQELKEVFTRSQYEKWQALGKN